MKGLPLGEVVEGQFDRFHIWETGPTLLYVGGCLSQAPTTIPCKVGNSHCRGTARTGCAVEVYGMASRQESV